MATFEIQNEVRRKEYRYLDEQNGIEASGSAELDGDGSIRHISGSVYSDANGQNGKAYRGSFNVTRQPDGTLRGSYNPQEDTDLDTLLEVKQAVLANLASNVTEEEEQE